ncbi:alanine dehydrogenase [Anaeromyxobacter diazotrophicus]|uniref:Alanine dehydrogenase n=1 Tax=Anaeromyxobacter diazotrophicus TaxID=2590199 RepID=A0A7I9VS79_9BACT|nr:alanine dehydrogenase [Anaeromyxobacter diazotrophicus]GEJ59303.1 alanine dehydrogenase [Anaeromyxobacter diazotrophicus]
MIVGVPKETKTREYRVGLVPAGAHALVRDGHRVVVEAGAGLGAGIPDAEYAAAGAQLAPSAEAVWAEAELIVKVKEPIAAEYGRMRPGQILYTYLHLAAEPHLVDALLERKVTALAYETLQLADGSLPLLRPMSEVAGRMSIQVGAASLQKEHGGKGVLLGGVPGVRHGKVVVLGAGTVGANAIKMAVGLGADVTVLDVNLNRLAWIDDVFGGRVTTLYSDAHTVAAQLVDADLVVGAVLVTGARAPRLVTAEMVKRMSPGSVLVDVAVDQGGCFETTRPTTHDAPTFVLDGVVHYCVTNMPGAVARTSTFALTNATIGYARRLAAHGVAAAVRDDPALARAVNTAGGHLTYRAVADSLGRPCAELGPALAQAPAAG